MLVPLIDLRAQHRLIRQEVEAAVAEVFESQVFVGGPKVESLERSIAAYTGTSRAVAVASGTDALLLLLRAIGVGPGDEVITSTFSFFATAGAIANVGATPVFADINPATYNIDVACVESLITKKTKAIVPVHLYGQCAEMDALAELARRHGLVVLEDAAQALGTKYKGRMACSLSEGAAVSFYPTKNLGGAGDGGIVTSHDPEIAQKVALLRHHGADTTYFHSIVGTNSRLDALQAAVLIVKMKYLDEWNVQRRAKAVYYNDRFREMPEITIPVETEGNYHVYHQYVIRIPKRNQARELLKHRSIGCSVFYPLPLHRQECFEHFGHEDQRCPHADQASNEVLALPIYPELTPEQQDRVIAAVKEHLAHSK